MLFSKHTYYNVYQPIRQEFLQIILARILARFLHGMDFCSWVV